jgi:hypothetical protein
MSRYSRKTRINVVHQQWPHDFLRIYIWFFMCKDHVQGDRNFVFPSNAYTFVSNSKKKCRFGIIFFTI